MGYRDLAQFAEGWRSMPDAEVRRCAEMLEPTPTPAKAKRST